jgi:hypothetical protein
MSLVAASRKVTTSSPSPPPLKNEGGCTFFLDNRLQLCLVRELLLLLLDMLLPELKSSANNFD